MTDIFIGLNSKSQPKMVICMILT